MAWGSANGFKSCDGLLQKVERNDANLVELVILPMKIFGASDIDRLASALASKQNTRLKCIIASGHALSPSSLSKLGSAIASQCTTTSGGITAIAIGDCSMGDEGVVSFCSPLINVNGGSLETVDLSYKGISMDGAKVIGKVFGHSTNLKQLNLSRNAGISNDELTALCSAFQEGNDGDGDGGILFPVLESLDLSECNIGATGMQSLVNSLLGTTSEKKVSENNKRTNLIQLTLNKNPIGSTVGGNACASLSHLLCSPVGGKSILQSLHLKNCCIGNEGLSKLLLYNKKNGHSCSGLRTLDLANNGITVEGIAHIAAVLNDSNNNNMEDLRELSLADNPIGQDGVKILTESLQKRFTTYNNESDILDLLDLTHTNCGSEGAIAVLKCGSFGTVRLFNNNLGSDGLEALATIVNGGHDSIINLDVGGNRAGESAVATFLRAVMVKHQPDNSRLRTLEIGGNAAGTEVEAIISELREIRPELDVAKDRVNTKY